MLIELCGQSLHDAIMAEQHGIRRIELNSALELGGLSPYTEVLRQTKAQTNVRVIAMLRIRAGSFVYTENEIRQMEAIAEELLKAGADGLAFGALHQDLRIQETHTKRIIDKCKIHGAEFVFHRAFDIQNDPHEIEKLIRLGADRLLTSGMKKSAWEGRDNLKYLQANYGKDIEILAGAGINLINIEDIVRYTGVTQVHGSFSKEVSSTSQNDVHFGSYLSADEAKLLRLAQLYFS